MAFRRLALSELEAAIKLPLVKGGIEQYLLLIDHKIFQNSFWFFGWSLLK